MSQPDFSQVAKQTKDIQVLVVQRRLQIHKMLEDIDHCGCRAMFF
jgi:hypothetical protein